MHNLFIQTVVSYSCQVVCPVCYSPGHCTVIILYFYLYASSLDRGGLRNFVHLCKIFQIHISFLCINICCKYESFRARLEPQVTAIQFKLLNVVCTFYSTYSFNDFNVFKQSYFKIVQMFGFIINNNFFCQASLLNKDFEVVKNSVLSMCFYTYIVLFIRVMQYFPKFQNNGVPESL